MFKHLTRTLKLGLTTLTILTAGAGAAFAQTAQDDLVHYCDGQNFRDRVNCSSAIRSCINNPFRDGCDTTLVGNAHTVAKVRFCGNNLAHSDCTDTLAGVNAASLLKSFITDDTPDGLASAPTPTEKSQFLKGTADFLDTGDLDVDDEGALYFDTATYKGVALGGDATDGVAFFYDKIARYPWQDNYYAGIFSGTDLGAPLAETMKVNWVGQLQAVGYYYPTDTDFILEIDFDGGARTGTIGAFVYDRAYYYHLTGTFDSKGVITGYVDYGRFKNNDRAKIKNGRSFNRDTKTLTGLIGAEGAVGAFHSNNSGSVWQYSGGFIARKSTPQEMDDFRTTCDNDPFDPVCEVITTACKNGHLDPECHVKYKTKRAEIINACITDGNANPTDCNASALAKHPCIANPFTGICMTDFADYYETARINRLNFCTDNFNSENPSPLCTDKQAVTNICDYDPFNAVCSFKGNPYDSDRANKRISQCSGGITETCTSAIHGCVSNPFANGCDRVLGGYHNAMQIEFCGLHSNKVTETNRTCEAIFKRVTTANWLQSFTTELPTNLRRNGFVKASATRLDTGVVTSDRSISLNLADATFGGTKIGGDVADGVAMFYGLHENNRYSYNVGILSGTDLGAHLTQTSGTAHWNGRFKSLGFSYFIDTDFVLEINFDDKSIPGSEGAIEAFVQRNSYQYFYLDGSFDDKGVITGYVDYGSFIDGDRNDTTYPKTRLSLTGLIGEEGAVGGFYRTYYSGGFVASPNAGRVNYWQWLNRFDDTPAVEPIITSVTNSDGTSVSTLENQFLQGTIDGLKFGNITKKARGNRRVAPDMVILDLEESRYDGSTLDGDIDDGVAFFKGRLNDSENYYYAGLLPDTNLGAPITQTQGTATWNGQIGTLNHDVNGDFELKIYFGAEERKVEGFTPIQGTNANHKYLYLRGKFDDYGVIDGHTRYGVFANGTRPAIDATVAFNGQLRGLIGQEGAVGVFISDNRSDGNNADGYSGGFVVENPDN